MSGAHDDRFGRNPSRGKCDPLSDVYRWRLDGWSGAWSTGSRESGERVGFRNRSCRLGERCDGRLGGRQAGPACLGRSPTHRALRLYPRSRRGRPPGEGAPRTHRGARTGKAPEPGRGRDRRRRDVSHLCGRERATHRGRSSAHRTIRTRMSGSAACPSAWLSA